MAATWPHWRLRCWLAWAPLLGALAVGPARAWSDHALCTWQALEPLAEIASLRVRAESLERFLAAQAPQLERVLAEHEAWAREHLELYDPRPEALAFKAPPAPAAGDGQGAVLPDLRPSFLKALRLNVTSPLPLFLQLRPGEPPGARQALPWDQVSTLASAVGPGTRFVAVAEGSELAVGDVIATASQEPDFGLDLGLYADSGTAHGREYGFGDLPFGNPKLDYATQAPFHMGLYHEAGIVFAFGSFLRRSQPEARIALFTALARHALASGHDYWGWRFAGWALHYVQDLTQPYHASILPGVGALRMVGVNVADMLGWERPKAEAVTLVSNRHAVVESYQQQRMRRAHEEGRWDDPLLMALRDTGQDSEHWRYLPASTRALVSREAFDAAHALDAQLERSFPQRFTGDPAVALGNESDALDLVGIARGHSAIEQERLDQQVAALLKRLGLHTRAIVREVRGSPATPPAQR
ncbi:MAG: hypothetical protein JNN03_21955 [Rubrivivax sp.]|nr:hypothetical protein [Rubrivivax sp.]